jgi:NADH:ubiquinone oxidoreductase subunit 2 (subunit N)
MFVYNLSLTLFFWTLFNTIVTEFKNLYSFSNLGFNSFFTVTLTILLLSMAGVPPFIGFFTKLFIIILLVNNSFFLFYSLFFTVLFLGLYFYIQNLRFLHSTNLLSLNYPFIVNERHNILYYYVSIILSVFLLNGILVIDDIVLFFT